MADTSHSYPIVATQVTPAGAVNADRRFRSDLAASAAPGRITIRRVLEITAGHFDTTVEDLVSGRRTQPLARRRQVAMHAARRITGRSLPLIGKRIGGRVVAGV